MSADQTRRPILRSSWSGVVLAFYAALLLVAATQLSWWRMECRAPQYGQRMLVIDVTPLKVTGDLKELDVLGHYVGMRTIDTFAPFERRTAPFALGGVALLALTLPFIRWRTARTAVALVVVFVPIGFALDLWAWQRFAVTHLDPHAPLSMIANRIQSQLIGDYSIAQFKVHATFQAGFWLVVVAALNALGFLVAEWRRTRAPSTVRSAKGLSRLAAITAASAILLVSTLASAKTFEVGTGSSFGSIGAAIAAASPGDEVVVHAGVYHEHVRVDRALVLRAEGVAVIDGDGTGTLIVVEKGPTTIRGFSLRAGGDSLLAEDAGVKVKATPDCVIENNRIERTLFGILVAGGARTRIAGNTIIGLDVPVTGRGDGIHLQGADASSIDDNLVERSRDLSIWQSNGVSAHRNIVRTSRYGLHYMYCDDSVFEDNVFEDDQVGAAIMYSRRLTLRRNHFLRSRGPSAHGLLVKVGDDVLVEQNWFVDNTRGIFLEDTPGSSRSKVTFRFNLIAGNDVGVSFSQTVVGVVFTENAFIANRLEVEARSRVAPNQNAFSLAGRGNYWSNWVGFDADGDGIGDTPFVAEQSFERLTERWPAVGLLRFGPAAEALEVASRAFPIGKPPPIVIDDRPLVRPPLGLGAPPRGSSHPSLVFAGVAALLGSLFLMGRARRALGLEAT